MSVLLHKNSSIELPQQISNLIRERILSGKYEPGMRLGRVRQFAEEFSVSPVTFLRALDILESENLIERIPPKGVYVSRHLKKVRQRLKACFAFPEKSIDFLTANSENYSVSSELYRGMMTGAKNAGVDLQFSYFEDDVYSAKLNRQLAMIRQFDFAIFPGSQLGKLQNLLCQECLVFRTGKKNANPDEKIIIVDYDRTDARARLFELYMTSGCKTATVITIADRERNVEFLERVRQSGGIVPTGGSFVLDHSDLHVQKEQIRELLTKIRPEFIFCDYTDGTRLVYEVALEERLIIGKDFQMTSIANGIPLLSLLPHYTFLQTPFFDFGKQIIERGAESIRTGKQVILPEFKVKLIKGKSIQNIK